MTYNVFSGTLNPAHLLTQSLGIVLRRLNPTADANSKGIKWQKTQKTNLNIKKT